MPSYSLNATELNDWNRYVLSRTKANELWTPVLFAYLFSACFCGLVYTEVRKAVGSNSEPTY